jgi:hypothetical protein
VPFDEDPVTKHQTVHRFSIQGKAPPQICRPTVRLCWQRLHFLCNERPTHPIYPYYNNTFANLSSETVKLANANATQCGEASPDARN